MLDGKVAAWHPVGSPTTRRLRVGRQDVAAHDEPVGLRPGCRTTRSAGMSPATVSARCSGIGGDELNAGEYEYFISTSPISSSRAPRRAAR